MSKQSKHKHFFHQTDKESAEKIVQSQKMIPGKIGLYGSGIYFANTIDACNKKALRKGVYLVADVYIGKHTNISKDEAINMRLNKDPQVSKNLQAQGYNSIYGYKMPTGREIVIFDTERIRNIKYCYGEKINASLIPKIKRSIGFWVTDSQTAAHIVHDQVLPIYDGNLGKAFYLFDTITDAISILGQQETFLAADFAMKDFGELRKGQTIHSRGLPHHFKTFQGFDGDAKIYLTNDKKFITNIHYCGGQVFDKL